MITNSKQAESKIIDAAIVAGSRFGDSMSLHAVDADLVTSTGVSCIYNLIPLSIEGFCTVHFCCLDSTLGLGFCGGIFWGAVP